MRRRNISIIIMGILTVIGLGIYLWAENYTTNYDNNNIRATSSCLNYTSDDNYAQSGMTCGPYSVAGTVRAITQKEVDSTEFAENIKWKIGDMGTAPFGLKSQLKDNGVSIETPKVRGYTNEERIEFLKERLSQCSAIILLGEPEGINYQHYITVLGFDNENDIFYIYDSLQYKVDETHTVDSNGDLPGNVNFSSLELLSFWKKGGMLGFYEWFAIVGSEE